MVVRAANRERSCDEALRPGPSLRTEDSTMMGADAGSVKRHAPGSPDGGVGYALLVNDLRNVDAPNPRLVLAFLAVIVAAQGFYAAMTIFIDSPAGPGPKQVVLAGAFVVYAAMIVAFAYGVWRRTAWAWVLALVIAGSGLVIAVLQIVAGDRFEDHLFGMAIDAILLYYLTKPSIRSLFAA